MIRKPADGWGRESPAVAAVRNAAAGGKAAVQTGGRVIRGGYLCVLAFPILLGAAAAGLGGSLPTLIGGGAVGGLLLRAGLRTLKPSPGAANSGDALQAPHFDLASGAAVPSSTIDYSRGRLLAQAGFSLAVLGACIGARGHTGGMLGIVAAALIPLCGLLIFASVRKAFGDLTALRWDDRGVTVTGMFKSHTVPWVSVTSVGIDQINTYAYGILKVGSRRLLTIRRTDGPLFSKRLSLSLMLLDLGGRTPESLVQTLQAAQLGRPSAFSAPAPTPRPEAVEPRFRHAPSYPAALAAPVAPLQGASPYRAPSPAAYGAGPARATFGRRGA